MQTVYARAGGSGGSQQREVADGADVVFTDTGCYAAISNKPFIHQYMHYWGRIRKVVRRHPSTQRSQISVR